MEKEQIIAELERRFAEPLSEFYRRRIIVWHDEEREFSDMASDMTLTNAKTAILTGSNYYAVKKLLGADDQESNYLLYSPFSYESPEDNWLLDIELYSEEFRADRISMWMAEMGLPQTPGLRSAIKPYRKFMNAKERRKRIASQAHLPTTAAGLQLAIMAALSGLKEAKQSAIIKAVLKGGLNAEENQIWQDFQNYAIDEVFWHMAAKGTGYHEEEKSLEHLAVHIMLTAATRTIRPELLAGLSEFISLPHQSNCYSLVSDWLYAEDSDDLHEIAEFVQDKASLHERFMKLAVDDLVNTPMFPCVNEIILVKLMRDIEKNIIEPRTLKSVVEKRRALAWYDEVKNFYDGLYQAANMQEFYKAHADAQDALVPDRERDATAVRPADAQDALVPNGERDTTVSSPSGGFHTVEPKKIWKEYTSDYYAMDTYYRLFHQSYAANLKTYHADLSDLYSDVKDRLEGLYVNWFLEKLGANWSNAAAEHLEKNGRVPDLPLQTNFYRYKVAPAESRVYVIISDALRYEVAAELAAELRRETQSKVELNALQGIFPTITKFGMAALLPHKKLSVELKSGRLSVLADGVPTEAGNRDKLLKTANPNSIALKYKDIINMKRAERGALVRGMDVVYIYHDAIDEAGHSETSVFSACAAAILEIKNMVRIITGEFSGTHILITSDHGFLYTYNPLREDDKVDKTSESDKDIEIGRRYAIMRKDAAPEYLLPVKFLDGDTEYNAFSPLGSMRIKMKGGGLNFVHGGISLQEMVVPLIDYRYLRNDSKEYKNNKARYDTKPVTISLLSASRKISNMIFSLNFYQKEAVAGNFQPATYQLYFTDNTGKQVSDISRIIAGKTEENAEGRTFRLNFNLKPLKYSNTDIYYLVIADENGLPISREEFQIDIAFAVDEFDFFS